MPDSPLHVALVQEYLTQDGGAEAVYQELTALLPDADLFAFFTLDRAGGPWRFQGRGVQTTRLESLARRLPDYRVLFPLFPSAARSLPLRDYGLVVTSSFGLAKSIRLRPNQFHLCYCHTPPRWLYDMADEYLVNMRSGGLKRRAAKLLMKPLRKADLRGAARVDRFLANSHFVRERIRRVYGKDATVVYPPVDTTRFVPGGPRQDWFFTLSRLVSYKNVKFLVEAFSKMPDRKLVVGGSGPELAHLRSIATPNVTLLGRIPDEEVVRRMQECKAFLFAAEEDFGIAPVEAQATGAPVVAYGRGGVLESVVDGKTGVFFPKLQADSLRDALDRLDRLLPSMPASGIRANAERFSRQRFRSEMGEILAQVQSSLPEPGALKSEAQVPKA
jgi:glycosyltransferase involved in cell wall biosynthesis